jgi:hypothetical protein
MASFQAVARLLSIASFVAFGLGCQGSNLAYAAGDPNRISQPSAAAVAEFGHSTALAADTADTGDFVMVEDDDGINGSHSKPAAGSSPLSSSGSAPVVSSTTGGHTVSGGRFPPQPLKFPPGVNQSPGWTVPVGPYRPLPSPPAAQTSKRLPE